MSTHTTHGMLRRSASALTVACALFFALPLPVLTTEVVAKDCCRWARQGTLGPLSGIVGVNADSPLRADTGPYHLQAVELGRGLEDSACVGGISDERGNADWICEMPKPQAASRACRGPSAALPQLPERRGLKRTNEHAVAVRGC